VWNAALLPGEDTFDLLTALDTLGSDEWALNLKEVSIKFYLQ
jgi:hypothetical protein